MDFRFRIGLDFTIKWEMQANYHFDIDPDNLSISSTDF